MKAETLTRADAVLRELPTLREVEALIEQKRAEIAELRKLRSVVRFRAEREKAEGVKAGIR